MNILRDAKVLAQQYRALTGKPLGITGEVAEYEAAHILGVELTARQAGYDATENTGSNFATSRDAVCFRLQARPAPAARSTSQKSGTAFSSCCWTKISTPSKFRPNVETRSCRSGGSGSKARNERGALGVAKFKAIGKLRWRD